MEQYVIKGGNPLVGEVEIGGAKNAALAILSAAIMTDETILIENLPDVRDINVLLEAIYYARDNDEKNDVDQEIIDNKHFRIWQAAKNAYIEESQQIIGYKLENLTTSYRTRIKAVKDRLTTETDARIIRMKQSQLSSIETSFEEKKNKLSEIITQSDIVVRKLAFGIIKVEN